MKKFIVFIVIICLSIINFFTYRDMTLLGILNDLSIIEYSINDGNECVVLSNSLDEVVDKLNIKYYRKISINDREIIEGYIPNLNRYYVSNNTKINVQISCSRESVIVGYPIIKNSF